MPPAPYHTGQFPPAGFDWPRLIPLLGPASAALARYDAPLTTQEAVLSSRVEATGARAADPAKHGDIVEVLNYRRAMRQAVDRSADLPLSNRLIRAVHATLMEGARGEDKAPGRFRTTDNYLGVPGRPIDEARFLPIGAGELADGMSLWERYIHADTPDKLVQLAVVHAETPRRGES